MARDGAYFHRVGEPSDLPHDPLNAIVAPRPIGWISSLGADGVPNLAPYSFFNAFNYEPPIVGFASIGWKDTVANLSAAGEFVWNLSTRSSADQMNRTSESVDPGVDEFAVGGLTAVPSKLVAAPRVLESPVNFECRVTQTVQLTTVTGDDVQTWLVLGQVVAMHIDREWLVDGVYDTAGPRPILRGGGLGDYFEVTPAAKFEMDRPS